MGLRPCRLRLPPPVGEAAAAAVVCSTRVHARARTAFAVLRVSAEKQLSGRSTDDTGDTHRHTSGKERPL